MEIAVKIDTAGRRVLIRSAGTPEELEVPLQGWSDWLRVKFKHGMLQTVRGMVRFHLASLEPELELYASPVNFDPEFPLFPISTPAGLRRRPGLAKSGSITRPAWSKIMPG